MVTWVALLVLAAGLPGCRVVEETAKLPVNAVSAVMPTSKASAPDPAALQTELQRFADEFASRTLLALDDYARIVGTPEAARQALAWKLSVASACVSIASGPNPTANLLDFLSLATITRIGLEEDWLKSPQAEAFQPWWKVSGTLETNAWKLAEGVLKPDQQGELRETIRQWWEANAGVRSGFFARPQEFTALIRQTGARDRPAGSVFALVGLDPTAGLDPAVREVTRTRLFAERALYAAQRMPFLLRWQVEALTDQLMREPQVAAALTNASSLTRSADRLSRAAESASQTAAELPDRLTAERKAILDALETQEGKLRQLSEQVSQALLAGDKMSTSLNTTITTFDGLMKRFGVGESSSAPPGTNSPPFNILDYARTAEQIALMAQQLDTLIKDARGTVDSPALDKRITDLNALSARARADAKSVLNHAFVLGAALLGLTLGAALAYRRLTRP
jgi:hypothetical protein